MNDIPHIATSSPFNSESRNRTDRRVFILIGLAFALMQCGPVLSAFEYAPTVGRISDFWLMLPFMILALLCVWLTWREAVPRLLKNRRTGVFVAEVFLMAYIVSFIELFLVDFIWTRWGILPPNRKIAIGWMCLNALSNSLMFFFTLMCLGLWRVYRQWSVALKEEERLSARISAYVAEVKRLLRPDDVCDNLRQIALTLSENSKKAEAMIVKLSKELRESLYHLPLPPEVDEEPVAFGSVSGLNRFLSSTKFRPARIFLFQLALWLICFGAFFSGPDLPEFKPRLGGTLTLLILFELVAAADYFILFRRFRRNHKPRQFIWASVILALLVVLPLLGGRIAAFISHPYNGLYFLLTTVLATLSSLVMMAFFVGGLTAMLLYCDWLKENRRLVMLHAAEARLEYARLRKQINPHFLFNVLNNAGILSQDEPRMAADMLRRLEQLMRIQFAESERQMVSLVDTIEFLQAYLALEATRHDALEYEVVLAGDPEDIEVPSLLYIPFVENAVKYATPDKGRRLISVKFEVSDHIISFECANSYDPISSPGSFSPGGLGLSNTLRRLRLLFDDRFSYSVSVGDGLYLMKLVIDQTPIT